MMTNCCSFVRQKITWNMDDIVNAAVIASDELARDLKLIAEHLEEKRTMLVNSAFYLKWN